MKVEADRRMCMYEDVSWTEPDEEMIEAQMKPIRESWKAQKVAAERARLERAIVLAAREWKRDQVAQHSLCGDKCLGAFELDPLFVAINDLEAYEREQGEK